MVKRNLILVVAADAVLRRSILAAVQMADYAVIGLDGEESALDWLWGRGSRVAAVFINGTETPGAAPDTLVAVMKRDWPEILVIVGESRPLGATVEGGGIDLLRHPWTPSDVARRLMSVSVPHAA